MHPDEPVRLDAEPAAQKEAGLWSSLKEAIRGELKKMPESVRVLRLPSYSDVNRSLRLAIKRAGIARLRPHDLRSTFITDRRRAGADIEAVAALVGHKNITTTKYYRQISQGDLREAVNKRPEQQASEAGASTPAAGA